MNLATADEFVNPRVHVGAEYDEFSHLSPDCFSGDYDPFLPYPGNHLKHIRYCIHVHVIADYMYMCVCTCVLCDYWTFGLKVLICYSITLWH